MKHTRLKIAIALLGLIPLLAGAASGKEPIGTLAGVVLDAAGRPVANATVTIQTSDGLRPHATHTDASGHFAFTRYSTGQYDLRAYANGVFSDWTKRIYVSANKTKEVTLRLPQASTKASVSH
jgi:uncharacterized GH25 family protein